MQEEGSDDWYLNRGIHRPGMITEDEVKIFARNGFIVWGGQWRQPVDYMHFQISCDLAVSLVQASPEKAKRLWEAHLENCAKLLVER